MHAIDSEISRRELTLQEASLLVGLAQPELTKIANGRGSGVSTGLLIDALRHHVRASVDAVREQHAWLSGKWEQIHGANAKADTYLDG
jgi:hypothetical protein